MKINFRIHSLFDVVSEAQGIHNDDQRHFRTLDVLPALLGIVLGFRIPTDPIDRGRPRTLVGPMAVDQPRRRLFDAFGARYFGPIRIERTPSSLTGLVDRCCGGTIICRILIGCHFGGGLWGSGWNVHGIEELVVERVADQPGVVEYVKLLLSVDF